MRYVRSHAWKYTKTYVGRVLTIVLRFIYSTGGQRPHRTTFQIDSFLVYYQRIHNTQADVPFNSFSLFGFPILTMSATQHGYVRDLITGPPPTSMEYNRLGRSGLKVSKIILGAMSYGSKEWQRWVLEEEEALPLLHYAYKVGINTWDTVSCTSLPLSFCFV